MQLTIVTKAHFYNSCTHHNKLLLMCVIQTSKIYTRPVVEQGSLNLVLSKARDPGSGTGRQIAARNFLLKQFLPLQFAKGHPFSSAAPAPMTKLENRDPLTTERAMQQRPNFNTQKTSLTN